ncbi:MAG: UvrD-helicase domain-containing protein, partial [Bdellovibrionales bacterium]|nr:UvrD-helicase domain-containing protein [Bdellovibrionales bacterium]
MSSQPFKLASKFVQAGAGAGKTTALSEHVFTSLQGYFETHKKYPHLVVCTFTVKATQELREKLVQKAYKSKNQYLVEVIKDPSHVSITTIHGLLNNILRKYALEFGLQPDFQLQDELTEERFRRKLTRSIFIDNKQSQKILEQFSFREINEILYKLFLVKLDNPNLTSVTDRDITEAFEKKREELTQKASYVLNYVSQVQAFDEFTSYLKSLTSNVSLIKDVEDIKFPRFSKKFGFDEEVWNEIKGFRDNLKSESNKAYWDEAFWSENIQLFKDIDSIFNTYFEAMLERKIVNSKICLSEIEGVSNFLLEKFPDIGSKVQEQIDYWYIDEFQDTSP